MSIEDVTIIYTCNYNSDIIIILVSPVLSSNEVDLLRYCTEVDGIHGTGTFRAQDLSFLRTNSPYGGTFVPETFRSRELSFPGNESSWELSFPGPFVRGTFVPRTFRSQELSFLRLLYKALTMNADSCSNCQNLFRRCVRVVFFC